MKYVIMSGRYETGTEEQKMMYTMLFGQERIVDPVFRLLLRGKNDLPAEEPVAAVIKRLERSVPEAEEPDMEIPLVTLLPLLL